MENKIADMNALYDAFRASMKGSAWKEESQRFEIDFLSELAKLKSELETKSYKTSNGTEFTLCERGKLRYIHGSGMRDRIVRHALCDQVLTDAFAPYLIHNNGASQKGKGISFSRQNFERDLHNYYLKHRSNDGYVGFVDISKFYDNIRHDELLKMALPKIDDYSGWLLGEIVDTFAVDVSYMNDDEYAKCMDSCFDTIKYHKEIPKEKLTGEKFMRKSVDIGDQVSQNIGIFYPITIDNYAKIVRGCKWYGRYMDDIYIIGETKEFVESAIHGIKEHALKIGLTVNDRKTRIVKLSGTYKYLQVKYSLTETGKVIKRINPKNITRERRKIKAYKHLLDKGKMPYEDVEQSVKSWMGAHVKLMSKRQIKNMKSLYKELFGKELIWKKQSSHLKVDSKSKPKSTVAVTS